MQKVNFLLFSRSRVDLFVKKAELPEPFTDSRSAPAVKCSFTAWVNIKSIWKRKILESLKYPAKKPYKVASLRAKLKLKPTRELTESKRYVA